MSQAGDQIGISGNAFSRGIPAMTINWAGPAAAAVHGATIFNTFDKSLSCELNESHGNSGEWLAQRRRNRYLDIRVQAKPIAATMTLARVIAADAPPMGDYVAITGATDGSINSGSSTTYDYRCTSAPQVSYTPEGETVITFDLKCLLADDGKTHITPGALTD